MSQPGVSLTAPAGYEDDKDRYRKDEAWQPVGTAGEVEVE